MSTTASLTKPLRVLAAVVAFLVAATGVVTLTSVGEPLRAALNPTVVVCAPATWLLDTQINPVGDTNTAGSTVYTVEVRKSPCYLQLTGGDTPDDAWVGGVAADIREHSTSWQTLTVSPDNSVVTVTSSLSESEMHTALEEVTGHVEWGVWESLRAEEIGGV